MGWLTNVIIEDRELANERIEVMDKESLYFLGPNLTLRHCTLVLKVPARRLHILGARFIDCSFEVKQELKNHDWSRAFLKGCRFKGRLSGCDFGHRLPLTEGRENGGIEDCDFSEALLDGCRFHGCDPRTLRFPKWPCFTVVDPIGRCRELDSVQWPGGFRPIFVEGEYRDPPSTMAVTFFAPAEAKMYDTTPEELRAVIEKFDCIVY
jgi:hypothetical protein